MYNAHHMFNSLSLFDFEFIFRFQLVTLIIHYAQVSLDEGQKLAQQLGAKFFEISAKEGSVEQPFAQCVRDLRSLFYKATPISECKRLYHPHCVQMSC